MIQQNNANISILVPVYNAEKYLSKCIDSILNQTFTSWECILTNDGSTDGSANICDEYAKKDIRIKVIHKECNEGLPKARKTGFENSCGIYILNVDSDDWIEPDTLALMHQTAIADDCDVVVSDHIVHQLNGEETYRVQEFDTDIFSTWFINPKFIPTYWGKLIKRSIICNIVFPPVGFDEDALAIIQVQHFAKITGGGGGGGWYIKHYIIMCALQNLIVMIRDD